MDSVVRANFAAGKYAPDSTLEGFLRSIRNDLREISRDGHVWVQPIPEFRNYVPEGDTMTAAQKFVKSLSNYGWNKTEALEGGVGYIKVDAFEDTSIAARTATHALSLMAPCQVLIIDLREHHGGHENMQQFVCSYFFEQPTELSSLYWTYLDSSAPARTLPEVPGTPLYDKKLYLLTSDRTASGAEAFAYNLKHHGRATLIGEKTAGAAHWTDDYEIPSLNIWVDVPVARPIHPVTGTGWEGTGVLPHIEVPAEKALDVAYLECLKYLSETTPLEQYKLHLDWEIPVAEAAINPVTIDEAAVSGLVGTYYHPDRDWEYGIAFEDGRLVMHHHSGETYPMVSVSKTLFRFPDDNQVRVKFVLDDTGTASEFQYVYLDGEVSSRPRVKE
jgi:hypothetical protein